MKGIVTHNGQVVLKKSALVSYFVTHSFLCVCVGGCVGTLLP